MRTKTLRLFMIGLSVVFPATKIFSQCSVTAPPLVSCTGSEPLVVADETLNSGTTKWYYGAATMYNSLTLKGGKLIVCGDLTIDKFYMDSGQVIINPGARFVVGSGIGAGLQLKGNCAFYNYGTLEILRNVTLESGSPAPNIIANISTSSSFRMPNQYFVINNNNSWFVNNGRAVFWGIITDNQSSPNAVCLGSESVTNMAVLINKVANAYTVSSGVACVYVYQFSQFYGSLTSSPALYACLSASHSSDAACVPYGCTPNAWGSAQVFTSCNTCAALGVLGSINFISFTVSGNEQKNAVLEWEMDESAANYVLTIERSGNGKDFYTIATLEGNNNRAYSYTDNKPLAGINYYRVNAEQKGDGRVISSKIVPYSSGELHGLKVYASYSGQSFFINLPEGETPEAFLLYDLSGRNIPVNFYTANNGWQVKSLMSLSRQVYIIKAVTKKGMYAQKIMVD